MIATSHKGVPNIMAQSWHTMMEFAPPLAGGVISGCNHAFAALRATRKCVINIPAVELARQMVAESNCSGRKAGKLARTLTCDQLES